ncbi:hypothetical protein [Mycolicibacterium neoaurum]|uniref:hypothetical protein n=1 Tax=Mycolicibacterium neoaurum TaxID=1795 RepID=UPI001F4C5862|nr:hypothetical protein [Mycolicibacterium neoaurum]
MKDEQSSGRTVREIVTDCVEYEPCSMLGCNGKCHQVKIDEAEAAINAHIVSVLEELGITACEFKGDGTPGYDSARSVCVYCGERKYQPQHKIATAIAAHKQEGGES